MNAPNQTPALARNVTRLSHFDLPGAGQVYVAGKYAYVGHITNKEGLGTSILDISDPRKPKLRLAGPGGRRRARTATRRASSATS